MEDTGFDPLLEAIVGRGPGAEAGGIERFPLAAGAQDEEDGFHADAVGGARAAAAEGMGVDMFGEQVLDGDPEVVGDAPVVGEVTVVHRSTSVYHQLRRH